MPISPFGAMLPPIDRNSFLPEPSAVEKVVPRPAQGFQGIEPATGTGLAGSNPVGQGSFLDALKKAVAEVNDLQVQAEVAGRDLALGQVRDLHQVTIATEKASLALNLAIQVRNKVLEAYQEIMRMQV